MAAQSELLEQIPLLDRIEFLNNVFPERSLCVQFLPALDAAVVVIEQLDSRSSSFDLLYRRHSAGLDG